MGAHQLLEPLLERLHSSASSKTIYGEPIAVEGKTVIPVAKVMYGLGGGFGKAKSKDRAGRMEERPAGESGGGGIRIVPLGIIEISRNQTRLLTFGSKKIKWITSLVLALLVGFAIGRYM